MMRDYNYELINVQYALMEAFLFNADKNVLDISYSVNEKKVVIQVVLLAGFTLSQERKASVKEFLCDFDIVITELNLTKEQFNENKGDWQPKHYKWLKSVLFSKAEEL